jgi:hypothetical protein
MVAEYSPRDPVSVVLMSMVSASALLFVFATLTACA